MGEPHYPGCWREHPDCAVARLERQEAEPPITCPEIDRLGRLIRQLGWRAQKIDRSASELEAEAGDLLEALRASNRQLRRRARELGQKT